jgi:nucleotide-binding universal stress UspA family protein
MERVIAAVDLSALRRRVADRARLIAEEHNAGILLVHAMAPMHDSLLDPGETRAIRLLRRRSTEQLGEWLAQRTSLPVEVMVASGSPARVVSRLARAADVIVAGTSSLDVARVGPITSRMARKAPTGVVAVRRQPRVPYRRVLAAVDLSDGSRTAVEFAFGLSPGAEVTIVYALPMRFDALLGEAGLGEQVVSDSRRRRLREAGDALEAFARPWGDRAKTMLLDGPPSEAIAEAVQRRGADLVSVASRGAGADSMVLLGTVAEAVMESAPCDVAIARVGSRFRRP